MPRVVVAPTVLALLLLGGGCSSDDPTVERRGGPLPEQPPVEATCGAGGVAVTWCDAFTVIQAKCWRCHGDPLAHGGPIAFLEPDDFQKPYGDSEFKWWEIAVGAVENDIMPFVALKLDPPVEALSPAEKETLLTWLKQCAQPVGGTECD